MPDIAASHGQRWQLAYRLQCISSPPVMTRLVLTPWPRVPFMPWAASTL